MLSLGKKARPIMPTSAGTVDAIIKMTMIFKSTNGTAI